MHSTRSSLQHSNTPSLHHSNTPLLLICSLSLLASLPGCTRSRSANTGHSVLRYPIIQEPGSLDPVRMQDVYSAELLQNIYEGLVTFDEKNTVVPCLASSWDLSSDGKTYTFHIRPNAQFHAPFARSITAEDVKYSLERALRDSRSPTSVNYLGDIVGARDLAAGKRNDLPGAKVIDYQTLAISLNSPRGYFLGAIAYPTGWVVCKEAIEKSGGNIDEKSAIGTGPFMLHEYRRGSKVILAANPNYWAGRPKLDRIERPIVLDTQTMQAMYENNEIDAVNTSLGDYVHDTQNPALKADCHLLPQANVIYLVMHQKLQPVFADRRVRQAFALAIDREEVARVAYKSTCQPAYSFVPPGMPGENPGIRRLSYDPAKARDLLAQAGFPGGKGFPSITLYLREKDLEWEGIANLARDFLIKNLGITISLKQYESVQFWHDTSNEEKLPFYITGWIADYLDPQDFLSLLLKTGSQYNHIGYSNPQFDALCEKADVETDPKKRIPMYRLADQIAMDDVAVLPVVFYRQPQLVKPYVKDYKNNLLIFFLPHKTTRIER